MPVPLGLREKRDPDLERFLAEQADAEPMTARCARCPSWSWTGPAKQARAAFFVHQADEHPESRPQERV